MINTSLNKINSCFNEIYSKKKGKMRLSHSYLHTLQQQRIHNGNKKMLNIFCHTTIAERPRMVNRRDISHSTVVINLIYLFGIQCK